MKLLSLLVLLPRAFAQTSTTNSNISTTISSPATFVSSLNFTVDQLWDLFVGPVSIAEVTTTASATPIPSSELIPPPHLRYDDPAYSSRQVPLVSKNNSWSFPKGFWWGVSSAAYQVEGAVKDEGRGPSIWDVLTHRATSYTAANETGDVANNQYYLYKQDIARIAALGVKVYSFSISWPRIMPYGNGPVNELGLAHYDDVIDTCIKYGVEPVVTLYHWDLPLNLQTTYGGWLNDRIITDFVKYAQVVFSRYGNKVSKWYTINEPLEFCAFYPLPDNYYASSTIPKKQQSYWCGRHALLAHAGAYRLGKSMGLNATISFKNSGGYKIPLSNSSDDRIATQRAWDFNEGWYANPIFIDGDYPPALKQHVSTFLPNFTNEQKADIKGSADHFAHNIYASSFYFAPDSGVSDCLANTTHPLYPGCYNSTNTYPASDGNWLIGPAANPLVPWLHKTTDWVPAFLRYITDTWSPSGGIAITEFGWAEPYEELKTSLPAILTDMQRTAYYHDYMEAILIAISEGINVLGCLAWTIVDNLEWTWGYQVKFGLQYANVTSQERYYKASFFEYVNAFKLYAKDPVEPRFVDA